MRTRTTEDWAKGMSIEQLQNEVIRVKKVIDRYTENLPIYEKELDKKLKEVE